LYINEPNKYLEIFISSVSRASDALDKIVEIPVIWGIATIRLLEYIGTKFVRFEG
jgi:hypothetical protein